MQEKLHLLGDLPFPLTELSLSSFETSILRCIGSPTAES